MPIKGKNWRLTTRGAPRLLIKSKSRKVVITFRGVLILGVMLVIFGGFYFVPRLDYFRVKMVDFSKEPDSADCVSNEEVLREVGFVNHPIFFLDKENTRDKVVAAHPCLKDLVISPKLPNKVRIKAIVRQGVAVVIVRSSLASEATMSAGLEHFLLVDEEGLIINKVATFSALPQIWFSGEESSLTSETAFKPLIKKAATIVKRLTDYQIEVNRLVIGNDYSLTGVIDGEIQVLFSDTVDVLDQLTSLQAVLRQSKIEGKKLAKVDLRFSKPHVVYK